MDSFKDLVLRNRSTRRFINSDRVSMQSLESWIDIARCTPSARNQQSMKYLPVCDTLVCHKVFETLAWAGFLTDWKGPEPDEEPSAYVILLNDKQIAQRYFCDDGIVAQTLMLAAVNDGYAGCMVAAVNRPKLAQVLEIPEHLDILMVLALGRPAESIILEPMVDGKYPYYRDAEGRHHVPKRSLDEVIVKMM